MMISGHDLREVAKFQLFLRRLKKVGLDQLLRTKRWRAYILGAT